MECDSVDMTSASLRAWWWPEGEHLGVVHADLGWRIARRVLELLYRRDGRVAETPHLGEPPQRVARLEQRTNCVAGRGERREGARLHVGRDHIHLVALPPADLGRFRPVRHLG
eukprot:106186-Prymnesium_polylepis.1